MYRLVLWMPKEMPSRWHCNHGVYCGPGRKTSWEEGHGRNGWPGWRFIQPNGRGRDGWMASPTQWMWVWASFRRWWKTGKPSVLQTMGLQSQTQLSNWTELTLGPLFPQIQPTIQQTMWYYSIYYWKMSLYEWNHTVQNHVFQGSPICSFSQIHTPFQILFLRKYLKVLVSHMYSVSPETEESKVQTFLPL